MKKDLVRKLVLYIVDQLQDMEANISTIRLIKFLYLIDMEYFIRHQTLLTDNNWVFYKYGPYFFEWGDIVRSASLDLDVNEVVTPNGRGYTYRSIEPQDISKEINFAAEQLIQHILKKWGLEDTKELLAYVYTTPPIKLGVRGNPIDFNLLLKPKSEIQQEDKIDTIAYRIMLASESILSKDWDTPEEDQAWAYLSKEK